MRIAIVGSREYCNFQQVRNLVRLLPKHTVVVSGGARGVDSVAVDEAKRLGLATEVIPADWNVHGKSAGYKRNLIVVDSVDHIVAFWDGRSKGTDHTIKIAKAKGKLLKVYKRKFYRVEVRHYVCGFFTDENDIIVDSAPIMKWAIGKPLSQFVSWVKTKRGTVSDM